MQEIKYKWLLLNRYFRKTVRKILMSGKDKNRDMFDSTNIETYAYCNRGCSFCFNSDRFSKRKKGVMTEELWKKIIDELSEIKYLGRISPHFFGEPLLDKRIIQLISYARKKNPYAYIRLNSNGDFLTEELFMKLIENGLDYIIITNYDDFENNNLLALYNKHPSYIKYRNYTNINLSNRAGSIFNVSKDNAKKSCLRPGRQLVINWEGNVILCCNDYYAKHVFGNVKNESIIKIWNSTDFKEYRKILSKIGGRNEIEICRNCDVR